MRAADPAPLTRAQLAALAGAVARELSWGLATAARELREWRDLAEAIPAGPLRDDALHALVRKRGHAVGAGLFAILPRGRHRALVRALVAYETILDFLDNVSERHPTEANGRQLHRAVIDAAEPGNALADYYRFHPWDDDGGYLVALVRAFRGACRELPSYERVRAIVAQEARRSQVLGLNHEPDPRRRDAALRAWARTELPQDEGLRWFEATAAASASLHVNALLALATEPDVSAAAVAAAHAAHWPWVSLATTMLDSWVDQAEDARDGSHSYVGHYEDPEVAAARISEIVLRAMQGALAAPDGRRQAVVVACMVALYLSKDSAREPELRATTAAIARSGGSLVRLLLPVLRTWRLLEGQRSA